MICLGLNKILGFVEKLLIARFFGSSIESDAFFLAQSLFVMGWSIMEDIVAPALIPILIKLRISGTRIVRDHDFTVMLLVIALPITIVFLATPVLFPNWTAGLLFPGLSPESKNLVLKLWGLFLWGGIPYFLTPLLQAFANSRKIFFIPALSQVLGRVAMLTCILFFVKDYGIVATGWGVMAYGIIYFLLLVLLLKFSLKMDGAGWDGAGKYLNRFSYLALPLLLGQGFSQATQWVDMNLISGLPPGSISALSFSRKLVDVPIIVGAFCLGVVLLPYLAEFHSKNQFAFFRKYLFRCTWICACIYSLLGIIYFVFGSHLVNVIYVGGMFTQNAAEPVAFLLRFFAFGLPVFALEIMVMQASFAMRMHWQAVYTSMACASLNIGFTLWLFPKFGIMVIPVALIVQKALKTLVLGLFLNRSLRTVIASIKLESEAGLVSA
jgi:putative peptidoglycan lipid II flippase